MNENKKVNDKEPNIILNHVKIKSNLKYIQNLQDLKKSNRDEISNMALNILGQRQLYENFNLDQNADFTMNTEEKLNKRVYEQEKIEQTTDALTKQISCFNIIEDTVLHNEMQNSFCECLKDDTTKSGEFTRPILKNYQQNLEISSELSQILKTEEELETEIFVLRMKYIEKLKFIELKWNNLNGHNMQQQHEVDSEECKVLSAKIAKRQSRIDIMTCLLQNFVSGSNENYGRDNHLINILLLCDIASSQSGGSDQARTVIDELKKYHSSQEEK